MGLVHRPYLLLGSIKSARIFLDERDETRRKNRSDYDREEHEPERDPKRLPHADDGELLASRHCADDAEQDVVDHRRAQNHLRFVALQVVRRISKYPCHRFRG